MTGKEYAYTIHAFNTSVLQRVLHSNLTQNTCNLQERFGTVGWKINLGVLSVPPALCIENLPGPAFSAPRTT